MRGWGGEDGGVGGARCLRPHHPGGVASLSPGSRCPTGTPAPPRPQGQLCMGELPPSSFFKLKSKVCRKSSPRMYIISSVF